jgi:glutamate/tyrosine decarboxylase-like PLP-dependent enzyme
MKDENKIREAALDVDPESFRKAGHNLIDRISDFLKQIRNVPVTSGELPDAIRQYMGTSDLPLKGQEAGPLLDRAAELLFRHSLFNGHPRFYGFITSSAAPIGALADLLAATVNPNVGGWYLSPVASEIEAQTIRWIAQLIGFPSDCGGILVSGGNMANFVCFLAARKAKTPWNIRERGFQAGQTQQLRIYASTETHTWLQKAADLFGLGTASVRWIPVDSNQRIIMDALHSQIESDSRNGDLPIMAIGSAGTISTGAIDPLREIAALCREKNLWFHIDGAYGGFAAMLPDASPDFAAVADADSIAIDPHKWLYAPLEAGCALVRSPKQLLEAFTYHPPYYHFDPSMINFLDYGPQNSRGFRALKVWLGILQAGRDGYRKMISDDILLSRELFDLVSQSPELQAVTQSLSITTFRFAPKDLQNGSSDAEQYLDKLNRTILERLDLSGEAFVSNAVVDGKYLLRACIVNFRTTRADIAALPEIVTRYGRQIDAEQRPNTLRTQ